MQSHYFVSLSRKVNSIYMKKMEEKNEYEGIQDLLSSFRLNKI